MNVQTNERESSTTFVGRIPELSRVIFYVVSTRKADYFDVLKKDITQYLAKELNHGGDICHMILRMSKFVIPRPRKPKNPAGTVTGGALTEDGEED